MSVDDRGTNYQYSETPGTVPIVLVHGVGLDQNIWHSMLGDLGGRATLPCYLLGHGGATEPPGQKEL